MCMILLFDLMSLNVLYVDGVSVCKKVCIIHPSGYVTIVPMRNNMISSNDK